MNIMLIVVLVMNKNVLKRLFKHDDKSDGGGFDEYLNEIWNSKTLFGVIYFGSKSDINSKECCKSKDGTCATMECPHNYRRYGDEVYEHYKELNQE